MYDSVAWSRIPLAAGMVAGYSSGRFAWPAAAWSRWPHATKIKIDVNGTAPHLSDVLDIERYDATPGQAPDWIRARVPFGRACLYFSLDNMAAVAAAVEGFRGVDVIVADWTNEPHTVHVSPDMHLVGVQYKPTTGYDLSVIYDPTWPLGEA
jgi:hypothetical protein